MERKSLLLVVKEWLLFSLLTVPFVVGSFWLGNVELKPLFSEFGQFLVGDVDAITSSSLTLSVVPTLVVFAIIAATTFGAINAVITVIFGSPKRDESMNKLMEMPLLRLLAVFAFTVVVEELIFRGFLLGVLPFFFSGSIALYLLVIISNLAFAVVHIFNYRKTEGYYVKIVPFFFGAFFLSFTFLKFGLFAVFLVHYIHNFLSAFDHRLNTAFIKENQ